jgi:hypothetical protein
MIPSVGRIVHYRLPADAKRAGEIRPAIIVRVNGDPSAPLTSCNLYVLFDGPNDAEIEDVDIVEHQLSSDEVGDFATALIINTSWVGSVCQGTEPGQWSAPPFVSQLS